MTAAVDVLLGQAYHLRFDPKLCLGAMREAGLEMVRAARLPLAFRALACPHPAAVHRAVLKAAVG